LKAIEDRCKALSLPFPLVMLHDVGWPYARRDGYYDPSNIPAEHLRPYEYRGLKPGSEEPVQTGGYNKSIANATSEGGPRNGVLTAVEDFVDASEADLELLRLPGLHGFGMLIPAGLRDRNPGFAELVSALTLSPQAEHYVASLENVRLEATLEAEVQRNAAEQRREAAEKRREAAEKNSREQAARVQELKGQLDEIKGSRSWRLITKLGGLQAKVRGG
jgi:hypothetical protein